jgi:hypothetical protein
MTPSTWERHLTGAKCVAAPSQLWEKLLLLRLGVDGLDTLRKLLQGFLGETISKPQVKKQELSVSIPISPLRYFK